MDDYWDWVEGVRILKNELKHFSFKNGLIEIK